jgi:Calcineurin-like phosphoesterase.
MKYFVVSDTHFGNPRENEEKFRKNCLTLIDIIKDKNPDEVILNGDILDTYFAMNIEDNPHKELYHALIDSHDKIRYILGNHDIIYKNQKNLEK